MEQKCITPHLAIAVTTKCNYKCFYCKEGGDSMSSTLDVMPFEELKEVLKVAYKLGIRIFRITGGEPTIVDYFEELIKFIMNLGKDTQIGLNTNGYKLDKYINIIEKYKDRIYVLMSVDSISNTLQGMLFSKHLSEKIKIFTRKMVDKGIKVRYNIVVTNFNLNEIKELIITAVDELGVDIKLLDLKVRDEYLGENNCICERSAKDFWNSSYVPLNEINDFLEKNSNKCIDNNYKTNFYGIPMSLYYRNGKTIQIKDTSRGTHYSSLCVEECPYYNKCNEGLYSPFLSTDMTLHISGCRNKRVYFNLKDKNRIVIQNNLQELLKLFESTTLKNNFGK